MMLIQYAWQRCQIQSDKELSGMIQTLVLDHLCQKFDEG
jgi:hypothetical protein